MSTNATVRSQPQSNSLPTSALAVLTGLVVLAMVLPTGCVNVKVDADGLVREYSRVLDRVTAEKIARDKARDEGIDVQGYKVDSEQREKVWWVFFEATSSTGRGYPSHFTVRVTNDGKAELMRSR